MKKLGSKFITIIYSYLLYCRSEKSLPENKMNIKMNICVHSIKEYCMKILQIQQNKDIGNCQNSFKYKFETQTNKAKDHSIVKRNAHLEC